MSTPLAIHVFNQHKLLEFAADCHGPVEIGRDKGGETSGRATPTGDGTRLVIATKEEIAVARHQARLEPLAGGRIRINNISSKVAIGLSDGSPPLPPGGTREVPLPAMLTIGTKAVRV